MEQLAAALQAISELCDGDPGNASSSSSADDPISPGNVAGECIKVYLPASCKSVREVLPHLRGRVAAVAVPKLKFVSPAAWNPSEDEREWQADDLPIGGRAAV